MFSTLRFTIQGSDQLGSTQLVRDGEIRRTDIISFLSDGPSYVFVNVFVRSFSSIDDVKMVRDFIFLSFIPWRLKYENT